MDYEHWVERVKRMMSLVEGDKRQCDEGDEGDGGWVQAGQAAHMPHVQQCDRAGGQVPLAHALAAARSPGPRPGAHAAHTACQPPHAGAI